MLFEFSKTQNNIDWYFVDCKYKVEYSKNIVFDLQKQVFLKLMSLNPFLLVFEIYKLLFFLKSNKISIVHIHHRRLLFLLGYILKINDIKVVYTAHLTYNFNIFFYFTKADKLVAVTESVKNNIKRTLKYSKDIRIISNPVNFNHNLQVNVFNNRKNIVSIGRLEKVKNFCNLIKAWANSSAPKLGYKLYIIGEGSQQSKLKKIITSLQVDNSVFLIGFTNDIFEVFKNCCFNVLVSLFEGQGIVTIEAASQKIPTLLSKVDGSVDCIPTDILLPNGVNPYSIEEIKECIDIWINNPDLVEKDGEKFYSYLKNKSNINKVYVEYLNIYNTLNQ